MDIAQSLESSSGQPIRCIDMHTTGEPTRIIYSGFPALSGTLLEQRDQAKQQYDHIRKRLMLEPRGHDGMYGAIIRPTTELVSSGVADIGVLFIHNDGFSTMCGHATLALGRFLIDTHDLQVFPCRNRLQFHKESRSIALTIHAPCGLVRVSVPVSPDGRKSDPTRPVSFLSTPAFASALRLDIDIPESIRDVFPKKKKSITLDVSYGGAFYALIDVRELGFPGLKSISLDEVTRCIQSLKPYLMSRSEIRAAVQHPDDSRLSFLYAIMLVDSDSDSNSNLNTSFSESDSTRVNPDNILGSETGLCYFAGAQIDRSPTGSCVSARMALAYAKRKRGIGQRWAYNSLVSNAFGDGVFTAEIVDEVKINREDGGVTPGVVVKVEGKAYYTGSVTLVLEEEDGISSEGFTMVGVANF
ncbi:hypothetical protein EYZ11_010728 [Aspergillus tanneri]|uniref:trans-L-3-hydroxyproline dehydratase n=1 Tax=Aspergillus tanneri TaxID=1220188 RepID=A0A4S3J4L9_9EURO|nr:Trans-L-3-hydroxyproline dehydratase [Aspergillus tanneri]KAA8642869.1 Trans-L-3-hydroxyproline dehydratase [Aspergillus tanneri]THC89819.1 hypothetical protein EYZ11_010728 [Aspergillus tanneri]